MIPDITITFNPVADFPEVNEPNYSQKVEESCNQHKAEMAKFNSWTTELNNFGAEVNNLKTLFTQDVETFGAIKDEILASEPYMNNEKVNEIKAEMDLIDLVASDAQLIQDTANLIHSVERKYRNINSDYTAEKTDWLFVDTTGGVVNITLPATAELGDTITVQDVKDNFETTNCVVLGNGKNINGNSQIELTIDGLTVSFVYVVDEWRIF